MSEKVIGVKFEQNQGDKKYYSKTYYYKTDREVNAGDKIKVRVPSGGTPDAKVVSVSKNSNRKRLKKWEE
jgi:hypothetical protein